MEVSIKVPFPSEREAEIVYNTLRVDPEPKRSQLVRHVGSPLEFGADFFEKKKRKREM